MRQVLHGMTDASGVETLGLDGVFHLISDGAQTMNVDQMLEAHKQLIGEEITQADMEALLKSLDISHHITVPDFINVFGMLKTDVKKRKSIELAELDGGGGKLTRDDLKAAVAPRMTFAGQFFDDDAVKEMINRVNGGKNDEFIAAEDYDKAQTLLTRRKKIYEAFKVWDKNGDGEVDARDLYNSLKAQGDSVTMEEVQEIIDETDFDKDGVINFGDFNRAMDRPSFTAADRPSFSEEGAPHLNERLSIST
mmetsp:Transcript_87238/g.247750  ORF Transcript_87238/g.247750 Transcript_87238/m.247750 type:complete len:251 (+) Transcript_87238:406-1158(+)